MQVSSAHAPVMGRRVVLGGVVGQIGGARAPVDVELALRLTVLEPVEAHVDGFGAALFDGAGREAGSEGIVSA